MSANSEPNAGGLVKAEGPPWMEARRQAIWRDLRESFAPPLRFADRRESFAQLDTWLGNLESRRAFVLGPPGRGASSALSQWAFHTATQSDFDVVLAPLRRRFRTALERDALVLLAGSLQTYYGPSGLDARTTAMLSWHIAAVLSDGRDPEKRPCLLIVDGIEEAIDLAPEAIGALLSDIGPGYRVLVSWATEDTASAALDRLGWSEHAVQIITLPPLDREGIAASLDESAKQAIAREGVDLDALLARLSQGEPLLLRLYLDDLLQGAIAPGDLECLTPGLDNYLERRIRDIGATRPAALTVLGALASALGPIGRAELTAVVDIAELDVAGVLAAASVLVAGDDEQGYAIRHPRIAAWIQSRPSMREPSRWERRWVDHGESVLSALEDSRVQPGPSLGHTIDYYGAYLACGRTDLATWMRLVSPAWQHAWASRENAFLGFITDVGRARRAAAAALREATSAAERVTPLRAYIRCALVEASLVERAEQAPIGDGNARGCALAALAKYLTSPARERVLSWAYEASRGACQDGRALLAIARLVQGAERERIAREAAEAFRTVAHDFREGWAMSLLAVAPLLPEEEARALVQEAVERARAFDPAGQSKPWHLAYFAPELPPWLVGELRQRAVTLAPADYQRLLDTLDAAKASDATEPRQHEAAVTSKTVQALLDACDTDVLMRLLERPANFDPGEVGSTLCVLLENMLTERRSWLFEQDTWIDLTQLAPLIAHAGGPEAALAAAEEIVDVCAWLP